ncbi:MAG TPA: FAD-dependent oxidoreductase [Ignavibacteriales bacterium]|nr:FAD-dependent oxidoreductase [Ignavibacteriales bacterium]HOL81387.1 FAD-dependent oxidoreductase [Ignavibacteriales bacterium]HPD67747.1 FAD-dependent oxidoreductase [Ignavibacteriales bacterium]HPP33844.1 FAD-dependent oxidoreductase [Ignavibacteriales bacterium]HRR18523.1 FAD-dependent oxidoreductase [Ignavibacteriales bacterium]
MMQKQKIIAIIGGNAAGAAAAANAKKLYPDYNVILFEKSNYISTGTCEIPLVISGILTKDKIIFFDKETFKTHKGVEVFFNCEVVNIDQNKKNIEYYDVENQILRNIAYDKIILATGSVTNIPEIFNKNYDNLFQIKNITLLDKLLNYIHNNKIHSVAIIGSGYIALETAEAFRSLNTEVTLYQDEKFPALLKDNDVNDFVKNLLQKCSIEYQEYKNIKIIEKENSIQALKVNSEIKKHDIYIISTGFKPNSILASSLSLRLSVNDSIFTNNYLHTNVKDILAAGDCTHYYDFFTKLPIYLPFASLARFSAYTATKNLFSHNEIFQPIIRNSVFKFCNYTFAQVGLSKQEQLERNIWTKEIKVWHENKIPIMFDKLKILLNCLLIKII